MASVAAAAGVVHLVANRVLDDRRGTHRRVERIAVFAAVSALATIAVLSGVRLGVAPVALGAVVGLGAQLAAIGTMHAAIVDKAPDAVARATGVTMTGYYLGALATPFGFGALVDATGTYAWGWMAMVVLLTASVPAWYLGSRIPATEST